jgi:hypothetical protein
VEEESGGELVVGRDQRVGVVHDPDAAVAKPAKPAEPRLDAVERRPDVEAADDDVTETRTVLGELGRADVRVCPEGEECVAELFVGRRNG